MIIYIHNYITVLYSLIPGIGRIYRCTWLLKSSTMFPWPDLGTLQGQPGKSVEQWVHATMLVMTNQTVVLLQLT